MADEFNATAAQAIEDIFDSMGESATYTANGWVPNPAIPDPIVVVVDRDSSFVANGFEIRAPESTIRVILKYADVPDPRKGDTIATASATFEIVNEDNNDGLTVDVVVREL